MKSVLLSLLVGGSTLLFAQRELITFHNEVSLYAGENDHRSCALRIELTHHAFPDQDSAGYRIRVFLQNPSYAEADYLLREAPHSDVYLSGEEAMTFVDLLLSYEQSSNARFRTLRLEPIAPGLRAGYQMQSDQANARPVVELWGVRKYLVVEGLRPRIRRQLKDFSEAVDKTERLSGRIGSQ